MKVCSRFLKRCFLLFLKSIWTFFWKVCPWGSPALAQLCCHVPENGTGGSVFGMRWIDVALKRRKAVGFSPLRQIWKWVGEIQRNSWVPMANKDGADGRSKEGRWRCGDTGGIGMTGIPMSSRMCIWRGRRGKSGWWWQANGREEKLIWDSFWSICLNWRFFGEGGPRQADTGWSSARVFSGKLPCRECWSREGEKRQKKPRRDLAGFYRSSLCLFALLCAKEIKNTQSVGAQL